MQQFGNIVAVYRTKIAQTEPFEQQTGHDKILETLLQPLRCPADMPAHSVHGTGEIPDFTLDAIIDRIGNDIGQIFGHGPDVG